MWIQGPRRVFSCAGVSAVHSAVLIHLLESRINTKGVKFDSPSVELTMQACAVHGGGGVEVLVEKRESFTVVLSTLQIREARLAEKVLASP